MAAYYVDMPKVTIWIREEDYPIWKSIINKPEWLHRSLTDTSAFEGIRVIQPKDVQPEPKLTPPEEVL